MKAGGLRRPCTQSATCTCNPSCELFLRHALTTRLLNGMFCGVGWQLRPPETIPSPLQSGPKFKPTRYYSTYSNSISYPHCLSLPWIPSVSPFTTSLETLSPAIIGSLRVTTTICLAFFTRPACSRHFFLSSYSVVKMLATAELLGIES